MLWNSVIRVGTAGANIDEESPAMNVIAETRRMMDQRRRGDQLMGFAGSVGESQVTMFWSGRSLSGGDEMLVSIGVILGSEVGV